MQEDDADGDDDEGADIDDDNINISSAGGFLIKKGCWNSFNNIYLRKN